MEKLVAEPLAIVKAGDNSIRVSHRDLLSAMSSDEDCVRNLRDVYFSSVEFQSGDAAEISKLSNVTSIGFYCCKNTDLAIPGCVQLHLASVFFETTPFSANTVELLGSIPTLISFGLEQNLSLEQVNAVKALQPRVKIKSSFPLDAFE